MGNWKFWIDCGGTFTDIIAINDKAETKVHKVLSHSPHYESAVVHGISEILGHQNFKNSIEEIRLGTTVATNAFLERQGIPCALITTLGQKDILEIRQQNRPKLFDIPIIKSQPLYSLATHVYERMNAQGEVLIELDEIVARFELQRILDLGIKSLAVSLLHSTVNPAHEVRLGEIAKEMGFTYISLSHQVSPQATYVSRTETAVFDAYLSPYLSQYTENLSRLTGISNIKYMKSDGTLCSPEELKGHNALLSGPSGGLVGAIEVAKEKGHQNIITFDMGGTSTDVAISTGDISIDHEPVFHGLKLLSPMVDIHTVAAGGGSILFYDEGRFRVGPESAKAYPGPACYGFGGPLTVTDANLYMGNLDSENFPSVFGPNGDEPLNKEIVERKFQELANQIGKDPKVIAQGFLDVAVETMGRAVKKISIERGFDPKDFTMVSFGGAGAQLAAKVCDLLGIKSLLIHPLSSVLSAYGIGKADVAMTLERKWEEKGNIEADLKNIIEENLQGNLSFQNFYLLSPPDSDFKHLIPAKNLSFAQDDFCKLYKKLFGLSLVGTPICESVFVKGSLAQSLEAKLSEKEILQVKGPKLLPENQTSILIPEGWEGIRDPSGCWEFKRFEELKLSTSRPQEVELEIFYQRFQFIAEGMGHTLQKLAKSVNIKERKDFSCALFTKEGELIANAPHIPVHLGSMGDVVLNLIENEAFREGDMFLCNSPKSGGTHLPDLTVVAPVYFEGKHVMWVASRGHHADIGGITPGSMPGHSQKLSEEGVIIDSLKIVEAGEIQPKIIEEVLTKAPYPVRNLSLNLHDIQAKVAANNTGISQLREIYGLHGEEKVAQKAEEILSYSHKKIESILKQLPEKKGIKVINDKREIHVSLKKENDLFLFDFTGTSKRRNDNFNTPQAVSKAAVLFCLRCLIDDDIPLNAGIMRSIQLIFPEDSFLTPAADSAVVSGNVETSQALCDALFSCLGVMANSQGTMNNLSFGDEEYQYYETLAGGSGATAQANGTSAVQVHMTNSLLTDPEVFENRFPVMIELMGIRHGSGGEGKFRGGDGISRRLRFLRPMTVSLISQSRVAPPQGLSGGSSAQVGLNLKEDLTGNTHRLEESFTLPFEAGEALIIDTPGGGGCGEASREGETYIFSFGSNMDIQQIKTRCPSAHLVTRAYARDRELRYSLYSEVRHGGVADMTRKEGESVTGLLIAINQEDLKTLDGIECGLNAYQRIPLTVEDDNRREYQAFTYDVIDKEPDIPPSRYYEWLVYSGAYGLNTSKAYLSNILKASSHSEEL